MMPKKLASLRRKGEGRRVRLDGKGRGLAGEMSKKSQYIILALVILLVVVLLNLPNPTAGKLKLAISGLFLPLFGLAASTHEVATKVGESMTSRDELLRENAVLRTNNQILTIQSQQASHAIRENTQLRQMLRFQQQHPNWKLQAARVIVRDPESWWRTIWLDVGGDTPGIRTNLPVLTVDGLVGKIIHVGTTRSQAVLLGDPSLHVAVMTGTNRMNGIVAALSPGTASDRMVNLEELSSDEVEGSIRPGDEVVTWGAGEVFPSGIPVGTVVDIVHKDNGMTTEARVHLSARMDALENVWVLIP
jgi:rod shape-determining protein MreC